MTRKVIQSALVLATLFCIAGCDDLQTGDRVNSQTAPKRSLKDVIYRIDNLADKIIVGLVDGETEKAHDPVHRLLRMLNETDEMIETASLGDQEKQELRQAVQILKDNFGVIDRVVHGNQELPDMTKIRTESEDALSQMRQILQLD